MPAFTAAFVSAQGERPGLPLRTISFLKEYYDGAANTKDFADSSPLSIPSSLPHLPFLESLSSRSS